MCCNITSAWKIKEFNGNKNNKSIDQFKTIKTKDERVVC